MKLYDELKWRGLVDNITDPTLEERINNGGLTFYIGVDPTAESLHIGHYSSAIAMCKRLLDGGHHPIFLMGGGTGLIGDPKPNLERPMISKEAVLKNVEGITKQVNKLLGNGVKFINNASWLCNMDAIDFLRDYGKFFNINYMLSKDTVKRRLDIGITYTEFSYMILQSIDFLKLYENENCEMQIGGQDQWGNITAGLELIRKIHGIDTKCYGLTMPLITRADGTKFGKSETGESLWLDEEKTTPYQMYQYLINTEDSKVIEYLKKLTFLSVEEITELEKSLIKEPELRIAQKALAYETVKFIHGNDKADEAKRVSEEVFSKGYNVEGMPSKEIESDDINILDLLVLIGITDSKSEARRLVTQNGISINNEKVIDPNTNVKEYFKDKSLVVSKGKKTHIKVDLK